MPSLVLILLALLWPTVTAAQERPDTLKGAAQRVELHAIPSLTLSDTQFLTGDKSGTPVTVTAEFRIAQGQGKLPVVILMHGSGGIGPNVPYWSDRLNAMGISTLAIDGFTGRGITGTSTNQALLGRLNFILDIYRALDVLAKHPRVDTSRVALMGFSRGGQAALYASLDRFHKLWNTSGLTFAAYVPFYPDCATTYLDDTAVASVPIRIHHGTPDDYNPVRTCKAYRERLKAAGRDVEITEYPNAPHGFDNPIAPSPGVVATGAQTVRNCAVRESVGGVLVNTQTNAPFTYKDACVEQNPTVGADHPAREAATKSVTDFFRNLFKLG